MFCMFNIITLLLFIFHMVMMTDIMFMHTTYMPMPPCLEDEGNTQFDSTRPIPIY